MIEVIGFFFFFWEASLPYFTLFSKPCWGHPLLPRLLSLHYHPHRMPRAAVAACKDAAHCPPTPCQPPLGIARVGFLCKPNTPAFICITLPLRQKEKNKIKEQSTAVNTNLKAESSIPSSSNTCPRTPNSSIERWHFWKEVAEKRQVFSEIPEA